MSNDELDKIVDNLSPDGKRAVEYLKSQLKIAEEQRDKFKRMLFDKKSERLPPMKGMDETIRRVVEEEELTVEGEPMPKEKEKRDHELRRKRRAKSEGKRKKNKKLKKNLPVVHERVEVSLDKLPEGMTLEDFREVSCNEVVRRVEHVREHLVMMEYHLQCLASKNDADVIIRASAPPGVSPGCQYGPGLHADVVVSKCADSIPLQRKARMLSRSGYPIAPSTLVGVFHRSATVFKPLYDRFLELIRTRLHVHADETRTMIQQKGGCITGWMWGLMSDDIIVYRFDVSRGGKVAEDFIGDFNGVLIADGYSGYNKVGDEECKRAGCWGHGRRKFYEALASDDDAKVVLELIVKLYLVEREAQKDGIVGTSKHLRLRTTKSKPIVDAIEKWIDQHEDTHPPKSNMGKATTYFINQRQRLRLFLTDPKIPLDNNAGERGLRIIALGRKNFLFCGSSALAQNLAILQTIVSTCQLHRVNPHAYLKDLLIRIQGKSGKELDEFLPWRWTPPPDPLAT